MPLADDVNLDRLAASTEGFTGADIRNVCQKAVLATIRENPAAQVVGLSHFQAAISSTPPSVTPEVEQQFSKIAASLLRK
jgi:transitional endoplasmic reticulum ATPase